MYPIEVALRSGLLGPWTVPDIGDLPGVNPGGVDPWGIDNFQIFPNLEILIYRGWYLAYRYWPTSHNTHQFEGMLYFQPATTVARAGGARGRGRRVQGVRACRTPAPSRAPSRRWIPACCDEFPLCDQEILVRHFHKTVADWVEEHQREREPCEH